MNVIVIFGALVGATGFLFVRFLLWKYGMMFRMICWAIGVTPASGKAWALQDHADIEPPDRLLGPFSTGNKTIPTTSAAQSADELNRA